MEAETLPLDDWLEESGALRRGHFQLSSGLHSPAYVQCALLLEQPARARLLGTTLAGLLNEIAPDSVVSPALGGLIIGYEVAVALGKPFRFVERVEGSMAMRRGFALEKGERVVIVEDVVTTGKSTREAMQVVADQGGTVCGVASILDRTEGKSPFDVPFVNLLELVLPTYRPTDCPLCQSGTPIDKPGSRPIP